MTLPPTPEGLPPLPKGLRGALALQHTQSDWREQEKVHALKQAIQKDLVENNNQEDPEKQKSMQGSLTQLRKDMERGVQASGKLKRELTILCKACEEIALPVNPDLIETEDIAKDLHKKRLELYQVEDPFVISDKFEEVSDISDLPVIGLYDIFNYLIDTTACDQKRIKAYKSAEDHRLFSDGHVLKVLKYDNGTSPTLSILAHVKPTQRDQTYLKRKYYRLWILIRKEGGIILCAHCECKGGSDGACRHIGATLYDLESHKEKIKSCTDVPMPWIKRGMQDDQPTEIRQLAIATAQYSVGDETFCTSSLELVRDPRHPGDRDQPTNAELQHFWEGLKEVDGTSCCISLFEESTSAMSEETQEVSNRAQELSTMSRIRSFLEQLAPGEYLAEDLYSSFIGAFLYSEVERSEIEKLTRSQSSSLDWHHLRKDKLTASEMHRVASRLATLKKKSDADPGPLLQSLTTIKDLSHVDAIQWGVKREPKARQRYAMVERKRHKRLKITQTGLQMYPNNPLFGCSPDGIVECRCKAGHPQRSNRWLIEIKCPASGKDLTPKEAAEKFCGVVDNTLDPNHKYYTQIQCQLGVMDLKVCDLVVYTKKGLHVIEVEANEKAFQQIISTVDAFSIEYFLPYLIGRANQIEQEPESEPSK